MMGSDLVEVVIKVLVPRHLRRFKGNCSGHRALHYAGDAAGVDRVGVGRLLTQPWGKSPLMSCFAEADYVNKGDWVIYAAPNEMTNPYVIDVRTAAQGRQLGRTYDRRAQAILVSYDARWVAGLRRRMPYVQCARCKKATDLFRVSDTEWARVGQQWLKEVLCRDCYEAVVASPAHADVSSSPRRSRPNG